MDRLCHRLLAINSAGPVTVHGLTPYPSAFKSAEEALTFVQATAFDGQPVELSIIDGLTFRGSLDTIGAGMAVVLDAILPKGYEPDGFGLLRVSVQAVCMNDRQTGRCASRIVGLALVPPSRSVDIVTRAVGTSAF